MFCIDKGHAVILQMFIKFNKETSMICNIMII